MSNNFRMFPEYWMVLLQFRLNTGTYASNLRTFVWPHRVNQIFTMGPYKAKFPAGTHPGRPHTWPPLPETRAEEAFQNHHPCLQVLALGKGKERASAGGLEARARSAQVPEARARSQQVPSIRSRPPRGGRPRNSARTSRGHRHRLLI